MNGKEIRGRDSALFAYHFCFFKSGNEKTEKANGGNIRPWGRIEEGGEF